MNLEMFDVFLIYEVIAGGAALWCMSKLDVKNSNVGDVLICFILGQLWPCMIIGRVLSEIF